MRVGAPFITLLLLMTTLLQARTVSDIRYAPKRADVEEGSYSDRLLDIFIPSSPRPSRGYPVVFFVHGGGFFEGDKYKNHIVYEPLVERGYAVVSVNYYLYTLHHNNIGETWSDDVFAPPADGRFSSPLQAALDAATEDALMALKWVRKHARKYELDMSRVALYGGSAGAMTIINMAYNIRPHRPQIGAVVNLWGAIDTPERILPGDPPMLTIHGDRDDLVSVEFAYAIQRRMDLIGMNQSRLILMQGRRHAQYKHVSQSLIDEIVFFLDDVLDYPSPMRPKL